MSSMDTREDSVKMTSDVIEFIFSHFGLEGIVESNIHEA